jgi:hypothetical protein
LPIVDLNSRRRVNSTVRLLRMNYKPAFLMVAFAMVLVAVATAAAIQTPDKLTFKMDLCGVGAFSSHQRYTASDGSSLNVDDEMHMTLAKAKKAFAKELKVAKRITDRTDLFDEAGKKIGERIIFVTGTVGSERTVWLSIKEKFVYKIEAASLRHINAFREWETQPNKSLDASGGGVNSLPISNCRLSI